jgi:hypothetical protein
MILSWFCFNSVPTLLPLILEQAQSHARLSGSAVLRKASRSRVCLQAYRRGAHKSRLQALRRYFTSPPPLRFLISKVGGIADVAAEELALSAAAPEGVID